MVNMLDNFWFHFTGEKLLIEKGGGAFSVCQSHAPAVVSPQAASLPMSIIIVGVGPAEFDGKCCVYVQSGPESFRYHRCVICHRADLHSLRYCKVGATAPPVSKRWHCLSYGRGQSLYLHSRMLCITST